MATNDIHLSVSDNNVSVPLTVSGSRNLRTLTPQNGSPYYVGARAYVTQTASGATITVIDKDGTTTAVITNGADGQDGADGNGITDISLTSSAANVDTYTITYDDGSTETFNVTNGIDGQDGADGADGADGYSPTATVNKSGDTATITITDINGTTTATVKDGTQANAFTAEAGTTTYADVKDAYDDGAVIICTADDNGNTIIMQLVYFDATNEIFYFAEPNGDGWYWTELSNANGWDDGTCYFASTDVATQLADGLMSSADKTKLDGLSKRNIWYGTCSTSASSSPKSVTTTSGDFELTTGSMLCVLFSHANSLSGATLKVDGLTDKAAYPMDGTSNISNRWGSNEVVMFVYDGSKFIMLEQGLASTTAYGITKLNNTVTSTSASEAATANAVKTAYDNGGVQSVNGSTGAVSLSIHNVPSGGTSGQVLSKASGTDYDLAWVNQSGGGGAVTDVEVDGTSVVTGGVAEIDLTGKSDVGHTHTTSAITDFPTGKTIPYAECSTAKGTVKKEVTMSGVTALTAGLMVAVKFANTNTATDPTLQINSLTATAIKRYGTTAASTSAATSWNAGEVVTLLYDGAYWQMVDFNNTTYSALSQSEMQTGTATTARNITAARLKEAIGYHPPASHTHTKSQITDFPTAVSSFTNDAGYLTSFTETDPVFTASDAYGISSSDISSWNGKAEISDIPTDTSDLTNGAGYITGVTSTSTPTASTISEFDASSHINSADMSSADVASFVDGLNISGNVVEEWTPSITTSTGTLVSATGYRWGAVYSLKLIVKNSSSTANGSNFFTGTLNNHIPKQQSLGAGFYSGVALGFNIGADGSITIRNIGTASVGANNNVTVCITYIGT